MDEIQSLFNRYPRDQKFRVRAKT